jgi:hypothetical protein
MVNRKFKAAGIEPLFAYLILTFGFIALSVFLFYKTPFAVYIYLLSAVVLISNLSETRRNEFLKLCFGDNKLKGIRITENLVAVIPFLIFLVCKQLLLPALILIILSVLLALVNFRTTINFVIPTPFYKKPFEFTVGFRNSFYLVAAAYALTIIAIAADNFNLGIFAMLLVFAITLTFYTKPENEYYVWAYSLNAKKFLLEKIKTATLFSAVLVFPIAVMLGVFFSQSIVLLLVFYLAGLAFLIYMIVSKYATYPAELNITQAIILVVCIGFPPLLIFMIPYFFRKSENRLTSLLQ